MIKSMTGFGRGEASLPAKKITVEIRSLNSKQLDLSVRMPSAYRQLEFDIRSVVQRTLQRGKVDLNVAVESSTVEGVGTIKYSARICNRASTPCRSRASTPITTHWFRPYSACRASYRPIRRHSPTRSAQR